MGESTVARLKAEGSDSLADIVVTTDLGRLNNLVTANMDGAARSLSRSPGAALRDVHLPLIRGSVLTAAILVFVDTMKDLPITILLRPFNVETLAARVHQYAFSGLLEENALGALLIVATSILPVVLLSRTLGRSHPVVQTQAITDVVQP